MSLKIQNQAHLEVVIKEYENNRDLQNQLKSRNTEIANALKEYAAEKGKEDEKGSQYVAVGDKVIGRQARRRKRKLDKAKAENFFRNKGMWERVIEIKEEIDDEKVAELIEQEELSLDEFEELLEEEKVTYAIYVDDMTEDFAYLQAEDKEEEEMPEVKVLKATVKKPTVNKPIIKIKK